MITEKDKHGFRFRDWGVYKNARLFRMEMKKIWKKFPTEEAYALTDQIRRATTSILLNIAEGSNKTTDKDTRLYINRALCSLDEVVACLDVALDERYINKEEHLSSFECAAPLARQLKGFTVYLKNSSSKIKDK